MATSFSDIYNRAIFRFSDYNFLILDINDREDILEKYLYSAQADFQNVCRLDLSDIDDDNKQYNITLDDECIEILSLGIAFYWLSSHVLSSEYLKVKLSTKEFSFTSVGSLLGELETLRTSLGKELQRKIIIYSYSGGDISSLKV